MSTSQAFNQAPTEPTLAGVYRLLQETKATVDQIKRALSPNTQE